MSAKICCYCNTEFKSKHSKAKFCSRKCSGLSSNLGKTFSKKYSDEELISILVEMSQKLGKTPSKREMTYPNEATYRARFGSWTKAVEFAGLIPNIQIPPSLKEELKTVSFSLRYKVLSRDKFTCQYCGGTPKEGFFLHADHIIPVSKGGLSTLDNLITSCWVCNLGKSNL